MRRFKFWGSKVPSRPPGPTHFCTAATRLVSKSVIVILSWFSIAARVFGNSEIPYNANSTALPSTCSVRQPHALGPHPRLPFLRARLCRVEYDYDLRFLRPGSRVRKTISKPTNGCNLFSATNGPFEIADRVCRVHACGGDRRNYRYHKVRESLRNRLSLSH